MCGEWQVAAVVTDCDDAGNAVLSLRNKFRTGDEIEIVGPDLRPFAMTAPEMTDGEGRPPDRAKDSADDLSHEASPGGAGVFPGAPLGGPVKPNEEIQGEKTMNADVVIVGAGPAGIFTALEMIKKGSRQKIIMVEKGQPVEKRHCPKDKTKKCMNCKPYCHINHRFLRRRCVL